MQGASYGYFAEGYQENVPRIDMPTTQDLNDLRTQAQLGNTRIVSTLNGASGRARAQPRSIR